MTVIWTYHKRWFRRRRQAVGELSESEARTAHDKGRPYCAVVSADGCPAAFVECGEGGYVVGFLDERQRVYLSYGFQKRVGRLFLGSAQYSTFGEGDEPLATESYFFVLPDQLRLESRRFGDEHVDVFTGSVNLDLNWLDDVPFEGLSELTLKERTLPASPSE